MPQRPISYEQILREVMATNPAPLQARPQIGALPVARNQYAPEAIIDERTQLQNILAQYGQIANPETLQPQRKPGLIELLMGLIR